MKKIPLSQGYSAIVDKDDYDELSKYKWNARVHRGGLVYAVRTSRRIAGKQYSIAMHRVVLKARAGVIIDHINGNSLDNRKKNLRICSHKENCRNMRARSSGTSRYRGVSWNSECRKWCAQIVVDGKRLYLGLFEKELAAAKAYDSAAKKHFGAFARLNT